MIQHSFIRTRLCQLPLHCRQLQHWCSSERSRPSAALMQKMAHVIKCEQNHITTTSLKVELRASKLHSRTSCISVAPSCKYLGVTILHNLSWSSHITCITNEANCVLGHLRHNMRLATPFVKSLAHTTLVRPKLEYACSIWDPHQSGLSNTLESVQNRAASLIFFWLFLSF